MTPEPIFRRNFDDPEEQDRADLQESIIRQVEADPVSFLAKYEQDPRSFNGRYIAADLFKEMFAEYAKSKETRTRYNAVVHNAAAVLSALQLNMVIADPARYGFEVLFLTGIPGAGKTSTVAVAGDLAPEIRAIFEGQLSRPEPAIPKIQAVLEAGLKPVIIAVHTKPEQALENTFKRFEEMGRGASINIMADIQGNLPTGLMSIRNRFGNAVGLTVIDRTDFKMPIEKRGWEHLITLQKEGNYEQIRQRLADALEHARREGRISGDCFEQASGRVPQNFARNPGVAG